MRSNHDDRPAAASEEGRGHGAEAVKCSRKIRGHHLGPIFFTLSKKEMAHLRFRHCRQTPTAQVLWRQEASTICCTACDSRISAS
mgnify:CR=1 FL=1